MFKVVWDKESGGVMLTMSGAGEELKVAPRPVYFEELDLLGLNKRGWTYPSCQAPLLWACDRRYFYHGQLVMEVHGGNIYDSPTVSIAHGYERLQLQPIDMDTLRKRNEDTMFLLEHEALEFIDQTYRRYKNIKQVASKNPELDFQQLAANQAKKTRKEHVVVKEDCDSFDVMPLTEAQKAGKTPILTSRTDMFIASFSGGKDSQVLLDLTSRVIPSEDLIIIYSDTGYEIPDSLQLYKEVELYYKNQYPHLHFLQARNHQSVLHYWDKLGAPSNIHRWCCGVMKTAPLYIQLKQVFGKGKQPHVLSFIGTRAEESARRASYNRIAKDAKHNNVVNVSPILEWNSTEVWLYLLFHSLPFNKAYRKGLNRVGCAICPFASDRNDYLCHQLYPTTTKPFLDKIGEIAHKSGVEDVNTYIKQGQWKIRAGGKGFETNSNVSVITSTPDFKALLTQPKESLLQWLKVLGPYKQYTEGHKIYIELKYKKHIYNLILVPNETKHNLLLEISNVGDDIFFLSHLKRVLNKATFCVHCEMCEVECPTGALHVFPTVDIDIKKCIHCHKCLDFHDKGCITANSLKRAEGLNMDKPSKKRTTINRYNNFGYREQWLNFYLTHYETFFDNDSHGLNVANQLGPFTNWLRDSDIMNNSSKEITPIGKLLAGKYSEIPITVWEIIWISLTNSSAICTWYSTRMTLGSTATKEQLEKHLEEDMPEFGKSVRKNAFGALQNTFATSPLGKELAVGIIHKEKGRPYITRLPYNDLSLAALAYSLYRYAEHIGRHALTIGELYEDRQKEGVYRQFGIEREALEKKLRTLEEECHHVLTADLKMGLDNINLREDITATEVLSMLL